TTTTPGILCWRFFLSIITYLNLAAIIGIWLAARHPSGRFAEFLKDWAPDFLPSVWSNMCFACRGSLTTWLKISAPESFCLELLHNFLMVVFVVLE
ncbi:hypothetical protein DFH28DRAFT_885644, partial [Melampsora americana]